jgi:preprotein translocase subunit SecF
MNRKLIFLTLSFLLISLAYLGYKQVTTGYFIEKDIDLKGGNLIIISFENTRYSDLSELRDYLENKYDLTAYLTTSVVETQLSIETSNIEIDSLIDDINNRIKIKDYEVNEVNPKLSVEVLSEVIYGIVFAFIAMAIVIFILFRIPIPSFGVILAAFTDIVGTLFLMNLLEIKLSLVTFTALLMLLGYSVDTDILLTTRVLKERGKFNDQYKKALKTGLTMTLTSLVALTSIVLIAGYSSVFGKLAIVLILGLLIDMPSTWIQNAIILDIYKEKYGH